MKEALMRSTRDTITFEHPFTLGGLDGVQPPGTYMVSTEEEEIPGLSFLAWRRVSSHIHLPAIGIESGQEQVNSIDPLDLVKAQARDAEEQFP
jgi:hypothetical protein